MESTGRNSTRLESKGPRLYNVGMDAPPDRNRILITIFYHSMRHILSKEMSREILFPWMISKKTI